jgi:DNA-binding XRE family transcriptional regulator
MNDLIDWLNAGVEQKAWTYADVSRLGGISKSTLSSFVSGKSKPGIDLCLAIARAFREPPEKIFRLAGILPPVVVKQCPELEEVREMLAYLPDSVYQQTMIVIRALVRDAYERALNA